MKKILVIYHGECWDGFGGAYTAWKKFGNKAEYFGPRRGDIVPVGKIKNREVYIIDYDLRDERLMKKLVKQNKKVVTIDHHISGEKFAKMSHEHFFDLKHSGAVLAWKYFHPKKPLPWLFKRIEAFDIWKLSVPHTKEIVAYMDMLPQEFKIWDKIVRILENIKTRAPILKQGKLLRVYEDKRIDKMAKRATIVEFEGYKTFAANSPFWEDLIAAKLYKKLPPIAIVWREKEGIGNVSLRSNGKVNVAKIAEKYGGGGHKESSGFSFDPDKGFPWKRLKK